MSAVLLVLHALLAVAAVVVSIVGVLTKIPSRTRASATWLFAVVLTQTTIGDVLYPIYLNRAKPALVNLQSGSRSVAAIFDVKEHIAFLALALTIGLFVLTRNEPRATPLIRAAFGCAHGAVTLVAVLGVVVASIKTP